MEFENKASGLKQKVYEILRKRKEEADILNNVEKKTDEIIKKEPTDVSDDTDEQSDSDEINLIIRRKATLKELDNLKTPFCYIDYNIEDINIAKKNDYNTLLLDRGKLTKTIIYNIKNEKYFKFKKTHIIINLWRVLTKYSLGNFSITGESETRFTNKFEQTIKWGNRQYLKDTLNPQEQQKYSLFVDGVPELLKYLYHKGVKIFIVVNCDYTFVKRIFAHYKLNKYIQEYFTPSRCGMPHGKLTTHSDSYKDNKKINKDRVFACIERYIGRLPKN